MGCVYDIKLPEAFTWYLFHHDYKVITYVQGTAIKIADNK